MSDAFLYLGGLVLAAYFFRLWYEDYRHNTQRIHHNLAAGNPVSSEIIQTGLPGSTPASWRVIAIAVVGSLGILALEVAGEYRLDVVEDQTTMSVLLGIYTTRKTRISTRVWSVHFAVWLAVWPMSRLIVETCNLRSICLPVK